MPFVKTPGTTAKGVAAETFQADYLQDVFDGTMDYLSGNAVPDSPDGPETVIIIRNNVIDPEIGRTFTGAIYVGKTIDEIKNDLK